MAVATSLLIAAGVSAGINAWNAHAQRKDAKEIAAREATTDQENLKSGERLQRQYLEFLMAQQQANAARYSGFEQLGNQGLAGLSRLKGGSFTPPAPSTGIDYSRFLPPQTEEAAPEAATTESLGMGKPWQIGYDLFKRPGNLFHPWNRTRKMTPTTNRYTSSQPQTAGAR